MPFDDAAHRAPNGIPKTDTAGHILVCVGPRCSGRGAKQLFEQVWEDLDRAKMAYYRTGGSIRLTEAGCLGACDYGPTVACYEARDSSGLSQRWFVRMNRESVTSLAQDVHERAKSPIAE